MLVAGLVVLALGLLSTRLLDGVAGDVVGGGLYALLVYLAIAFGLPRISAIADAITTFVVCALIELWQLTGMPAQLAEAFPPAALLFGTTFTLADLPPYAVGALAGVAIDRLLRRIRR
ncbi:DUF2809 domain-containing protein [Naasia lichenicola]|uniref:ribosomal maturation YjgA family protein n=1 Tax=Naasia lichenicola TaxID=2565933 RepID=UPI00130E605D|nr:DUF2809 domain-containing protein [Naasia lichenicola]